MAKQDDIKKFTADLAASLKKEGKGVMPYPGDRPKLLITDGDNGFIVSVRPM